MESPGRSSSQESGYQPPRSRPDGRARRSTHTVPKGQHRAPPARARGSTSSRTRHRDEADRAAPQPRPRRSAVPTGHQNTCPCRRALPRRGPHRPARRRASCRGQRAQRTADSPWGPPQTRATGCRSGHRALRGQQRGSPSRWMIADVTGGEANAAASSAGSEFHRRACDTSSCRDPWSPRSPARARRTASPGSEAASTSAQAARGWTRGS